jgi:transglutaminase 1
VLFIYLLDTGDQPLPSKETYVDVILSDKDLPKQWGAKIASTTGNTLSITVFTPPTCFVGKWSFSVDAIKKDKEKSKVFRYKHPEPIYMLFNPWQTCEYSVITI